MQPITTLSRCRRSQRSQRLRRSAAAGTATTACAALRARSAQPEGSDCQALAALGAASVDHGTAAAALHADEKTVRACAADFGSLVGAFHDAFFFPIFVGANCVRLWCQAVLAGCTCRLCLQAVLAGFDGRQTRRLVALPLGSPLVMSGGWSSGNPLLHQKHPLSSMT